MSISRKNEVDPKADANAFDSLSVRISALNREHHVLVLAIDIAAFEIAYPGGDAYSLCG